MTRSIPVPKIPGYIVICHLLYFGEGQGVFSELGLGQVNVYITLSGSSEPLSCDGDGSFGGWITRVETVRPECREGCVAVIGDQGHLRGKEWKEGFKKRLNREGNAIDEKDSK